MIFNTKSEFMSGLREAVEKYNIPDAREILLDFEQHFIDGAAAGESEADVCRKLGDVEEIAKQYVSDDEFAKAAYNETAQSAQQPSETKPAPQQASNGFDSNTYAGPTNGQMPYAQAAPQPAPAYQGFTPDSGAIVGIIILDLFVLSWAIPTLASLIISLMGIALGFGAAGIAGLFGGMASFFIDISGIISTGFAPITIILFGVMMICFTGMLVIASIASVKGFVNLCKNIINLHSRVFAGYNIIRKESK